MYRFPEGLYTDVRIEDIYETRIVFTLNEIDDFKVRNYRGALIRIYDGKRWFYASTTDIGGIQSEIDSLALNAKPGRNIGECPAVKKFSAKKEKRLKFNGDEDILMTPPDAKFEFLTSHFGLLNSRPRIKLWRAGYIDRKRVKSFYSSRGADLSFDYQECGVNVTMRLVSDGRQLPESYGKASNYYKELPALMSGLEDHINKCEYFIDNSAPVKPGKYTVVLSPLAAGIFAHESFGHKSEADFMLGDEAMKKEWVIGKKVGADILSIVDDGTRYGSGFLSFDDEGTEPGRTHLVKNGVLSGRLHSVTTAAELGEDPTGNARAINFEFEPIVRMTTTYIEPGNMSKDELISGIEDGIFVETVKHGSGLSTFTIAPSLCYCIKNGKIGSPVNVSVITGNVFETLSEIDGLSNELELHSFIEGGCGKFDQWPMPVGFGGPYVRVKNMNVQ